jgi:hypothetical protein
MSLEILIAYNCACLAHMCAGISGSAKVTGKDIVEHVRIDIMILLKPKLKF